MADIDSVAAVIDALGGPTRFAEICGFASHPSARGTDIKRRNSIPSVYFPRIVAAARELDLGITLETLHRVQAEADLQRKRAAKTTTKAA